MSKTLWYITKYFSPSTETTPGGRAWFLLKEMAAKGYRPVVITSDSNNLVEVPELSQPVIVQHQDGIQMVWLKTMKYGVAKSWQRIASWFHFEWNLWRLDKSALPKPDTIVVSSLSLLTVLNGLLLKRKYKCRLIFEVRDIWPLTITEEGGVSPKNPFVMFLAWVERLGYEKSDAIIGTMPNLEPALFMSTKNTARLRWISAPVHTAQPQPDFCSLKTQFPRRSWQNPAKFQLVGCFFRHRNESIPQRMADSVMSPAKSDIYVGD